MCERARSITVRVPPPEPATPRAEAIPLDILYEDEDLVVVNKPAGMVVHPAAGHADGTLVNAILAHCPNLNIGGVERPGIVHRLDSDTSGIILVAKNDAAMRDLQAQFKSRRVHKTYLALVEGHVKPPRGKIDAAIGRDPKHRQKMAVLTRGKARQAVTVYRTLASFDSPSLRSGGYTLVQAEPQTGRTHQIRVHLAFLGFPVVADASLWVQDSSFIRGQRARFARADASIPARLENRIPAAARWTRSEFYGAAAGRFAPNPGRIGI